VWEKIEEKMKDAGRESRGLKKAVGDWAKSVGREHSRQAQFGATGTSPWAYPLASKLVFANVSVSFSSLLLLLPHRNCTLVLLL
jgi:hypothetical protein